MCADPAFTFQLLLLVVIGITLRTVACGIGIVITLRRIRTRTTVGRLNLYQNIKTYTSFSIALAKN